MQPNKLEFPFFKMKNTYINGTGCVSAQKTFDAAFLEAAVANTTDTLLPICAPDYKAFIPPVAIRRMAKGVKYGTVAATIALQEAGNPDLEAIITGTGMGCIDDSDKFLRAIIDNNEAFLTPTSFIQSTHNTVGAQIALGLKCKAYNFTYVNAAVSFESAVIDAQMQLESGEAATVLVGGIDEMNDYTAQLFKLNGCIKTEIEPTHTLLHSKTTGAVFSEGATFFVLGSEKQATSYAQIKEVALTNTLTQDEIAEKMTAFLQQHGLTVADIDAVILGYNGDVTFDGYYQKVAAELFQNTPQVYYKHLSGEYNTASAFGLWVGANIIKTQDIPDIVKANAVASSTIRTVLLYNQYRGLDHSFIVISSC